MPRRSIVFDSPVFGRGIMCGNFPKKSICADCDQRLMTALCDFPVGQGKTCDRPICDQCKAHVGNNTDYCRQHRDGPGAQAPLFNGPQVPIQVK